MSCKYIQWVKVATHSGLHLNCSGVISYNTNTVFYSIVYSVLSFNPVGSADNTIV